MLMTMRGSQACSSTGASQWCWHHPLTPLLRPQASAPAQRVTGTLESTSGLGVASLSFQAHGRRFFQLMVAREGPLDGWMKLEKRFLNTSQGTLGDSSRAIVAPSRAHPLNWGRLPPLQWQLDSRRAVLFASQGMLLPGARSGPLSLPHALFGERAARTSPLGPLHESLARLAPALDISCLRKGQDKVLVILSSHPLLHMGGPACKQKLQETALSRPLTLTPK